MRRWRFWRESVLLFLRIMVVLRRSLLLGADLAGLARLAPDALGGIADALAEIRLGWPDLAEERGGLADELLVKADDVEARRRLDLKSDTRRRRVLDGVRVPDRK